MDTDATIDTSAAALGDARMADRYADLDDVRLHYVEAGTGRCLMFLHGFPEFWYAWRHQLVEFGAECHAVAPDMRGYNLSSKPDGLTAYRMRHLAGDIKALLGALGHERMVLVGHDWGGAVAWATAIMYPEIVDRLVIMNAPHPAIFSRLLLEDDAQIKASQYMTDFLDPATEDRLLADDAAEISQWIVDYGVKKGFLDETDGARYRAAWQMPGAMTAMLAYYRAQAESKGAPVDPTDLTVGMPTWVLWGMKDRALLPANIEGLEEYVPNLTLVRADDADHWVVHQRPDLVTQVVRAALES